MSTDAVKLPGGVSGLANPTRFMAISRAIIPFLAFASAVVLAIGLYLSLTVSEDAEQGRTVKIMFIHVPAVWMAMGTYLVMVSGALGVLVWRHPLAGVAARAAAPLGAAFTFIGLVTGSIWGRPMWGTWWVWDARLTSFLILLLIYLGLIALWRSIEESAVASRVTSVLILVGALILPVIKFSVDWFVTLHQPASVFTTEGPKMPPVYLTPLLLMALAFLLLFITLHLGAMRNEVQRQRIRSLQRRAVREARNR